MANVALECGNIQVQAPKGVTPKVVRLAYIHPLRKLKSHR